MDLQELAHVVLLAGNDEEEVDIIASCGGYGTVVGNIHRDLMRKFCTPLCAPEALAIQVPALDPKCGKSSVIVETHIILPSAWISTLASTKYLEYEYQAIFGLDQVSDFWSAHSEHGPKLRNHPARKKRNHTSLCVPLVLHGDGASFQHNDSLMTLSFSGLLKEGDVASTNLIIASFPKSVSASGPRGTFATIWSWLVWDLNQLFTGKYAKKDPFGNEFEDGSEFATRAGTDILQDKRFFMVWGVMGDMDFYYNDLGLPHWRNEAPKTCCAWCKGDKVLNNWFDFRPTALWRKSQAADPSSDHIINQLIGWTPFHFSLDWLHVVDLGVAAHALGNAIYDVCFKKLKHMQKNAAVNEIAAFILGKNQLCMAVH